MANHTTRCTVIIKGHIGQRLQAAFDGMTCTAQPDGTTVITGNLPDQSAVFGALSTIERLGLTLISIQSSQSEEE
jgi:hypothetical protein